MTSEDAVARMEAAAARMEAAAAGMEAAKGKGGKGGAQRGEAWHEKKRQRAERHRAGLQPPRAAETPMCPFCRRNQPSQYCANRACRSCCERGVGVDCRYHSYV